MAQKDLAKTLKELRLKAGLTQKQVYEYLGVPQSTFSSWEIGKAEPPTATTLKLCNLYGVDDILAAFGYDGKDENGNIVPTYSELQHIEKYRSLDDHGKEHVSNVLEWEAQRTQTIVGMQQQLTIKDSRIIELESSLSATSDSRHTNIKDFNRETDNTKENPETFIDNTSKNITDSDIDLLIARNGKPISTEDKKRLIKLLSEIE